MPTLADASLTAGQAALLERDARDLEARPGDTPHAVWLFASRARGVRPRGDGFDIDVLVVAEDASRDGKRAVHETLRAAARDLGIEPLAARLAAAGVEGLVP